jgi:hypothetical protein
MMEILLGFAEEEEDDDDDDFDLEWLGTFLILLPAAHSSKA